MGEEGESEATQRLTLRFGLFGKKTKHFSTQKRAENNHTVITFSSLEKRQRETYAEWG